MTLKLADAIASKVCEANDAINAKNSTRLSKVCQVTGEPQDHLCLSVSLLGRGCLPCDKSNVVPEGWCARQLIDDVDHLRVNINRTIESADRIIQGRTANERIQRMRLRADEYRSLVNTQDARHRRCLLDEKPSSSFCINEQIVNLTRVLNEFDNDFKQTHIEMNHEQGELKLLLVRVQDEYERVRNQAASLRQFAEQIEAFSANLTQRTNEDPLHIVNLIDRYVR